MSLRRSGLNPTAYMGVEPITPPQFELHERAPQVTDFLNSNIGTLWLNISGLKLSPPVYPTVSDIYMLVGKNNNIGTWINFNSGGGTGTMNSLTGDVGGIVNPDVAGNINLVSSTLLAGASITFSTPVLNTLFLSVTDALSNIFMGRDAGNNTLTGRNNTGIGRGVLESLTTGEYNVTIGNSSGDAITIGDNNTFLGGLAGTDLIDKSSNTGIGYQSLTSLVHGESNTALGSISGLSLNAGDYNILLGYGAGSNYVANCSSNIIIGNLGVAGESNKIRIGRFGTGNRLQNKCFIAAIYGITPDVVGARITLTDSDGQLGTAAALTNGQLLIGSTGANPVAATLTAGPNMVITPGAGTITIGNSGSVTTSYLTDDTFSAIPVAGVLTVKGASGISTSSAGSTVTIANSSAVATSFLTDDTLSAIPAAGVLTVHGAGSIVTSSAGSTVTITGVGAIPTSFLTDDANSAVPAAGVLTVTGARGIDTTSAGSTVTVNGRGANLCSFSAYLNANVPNFTGATNTPYLVPLNAVFFNVGGNFNTGTSIFTTPITGYYMFTATITFYNVVGDKEADIILAFPYPTNYQEQGNRKFSPDSDGTSQFTCTWIVYLVAGVAVSLYADCKNYSGVGLKNVGLYGLGSNVSDARTMLSGFLLV